MKTDVLIVGAGPAGLSAAIIIAKSGVDVVVVDEYYRPGGRLLGQHYKDPSLSGNNKLWDGQVIAQQLFEEAIELGVNVLCGVTVWSIDGQWEVKVSGTDTSSIHSDALLIATGAAEHALPCQGWTLPGVYSIGAAQTFTNVHEIALGEKVFVVGMDPLSLSVVFEMKEAGIEIVGVSLPPSSPAIDPDLSSPIENVKKLMAVSHLAPNLILRKLGKLFSGKFSRLIAHGLKLDFLKVEGVPLHLRKSLVQINGESKVESVTLRDVNINGFQVGKESTIPVDSVCLSAGLYPLIDLIQATGCLLIELKELGGLVPIHNTDMSTPIPGLFVAGNITGIEGAKVAMAQGQMAGLSILDFLGKELHISKKEAEEQITLARKLSPIKFIPDIEIGRMKLKESWKQYELTKEGIS